MQLHKTHYTKSIVIFKKAFNQAYPCSLLTAWSTSISTSPACNSCSRLGDGRISGGQMHKLSQITKRSETALQTLQDWLLIEKYRKEIDCSETLVEKTTLQGLASLASLISPHLSTPLLVWHSHRTTLAQLDSVQARNPDTTLSYHFHLISCNFHVYIIYTLYINIFILLTDRSFYESSHSHWLFLLGLEGHMSPCPNPPVPLARFALVSDS